MKQVSLLWLFIVFMFSCGNPASEIQEQKPIGIPFDTIYVKNNGDITKTVLYLFRLKDSCQYIGNMDNSKDWHSSSLFAHYGKCDNHSK